LAYRMNYLDWKLDSTEMLNKYVYLKSVA
jgi:hypothetical protein